MMEGRERDVVMLLVEFTDAWESTPERTRQVVGSFARDNKCQGKRILTCLNAALRVIEVAPTIHFPSIETPTIYSFFFFFFKVSLRDDDDDDEGQDEEDREEQEAESDGLSGARRNLEAAAETDSSSFSSSSGKKMVLHHQQQKDCEQQHTEEGAPCAVSSSSSSSRKGEGKGRVGPGQGGESFGNKRKRSPRQKENRPCKRTAARVAGRKASPPPDGYSEKRIKELLKTWEDKHLGTASHDDDDDDAEGVHVGVVVYEGNENLREWLHELNDDDEALLERLKEGKHIHHKSQQLNIRIEFFRGKSFQLLFLAKKKLYGGWESWLKAHPQFGKVRTVNRARHLNRKLGRYTRFQYLKGVSISKLRRNLPHIEYYFRTHKGEADHWRHPPR